MGGNICKSDKGLRYRIYKELLQLTAKNSNNQLKIRQKTLNRHVSKDNDTNGQKEMILSVTNHHRNVNQTTMRYQLTHIRITTI